MFIDRFTCLYKQKTNKRNYLACKKTKAGVIMAGHSKWSNIKFRKKAQDDKRCKIFNKISNEIIQAASLSDSSCNNSKLKMAVNKALSFNMPKKNIEKAIERGKLNSKIEEKTIEGFHNNGIFIIIHYEININHKLENEIKSIFEKNKCSLAKKGSYSYIFNKGYEMMFDINDKELIIDYLKNYDIRNTIFDSKYSFPLFRSTRVV